MCQHNHTLGDNYGVTCQDCGKVLEGYGYYGERHIICEHRWWKDDNGLWHCYYCEAERREYEEEAA